MKKVGKTTRPFRYDLNQIPYDYTVDVRNRLKGLDLIELCLKNYEQRFTTLYRRQLSKPYQRKRDAKGQNHTLRRPYIPSKEEKQRREAKGKREKERQTYLNAEFQTER